jgi:N-acetylmuramoyl-L-alanine amidase
MLRRMLAFSALFLPLVLLVPAGAATAASASATVHTISAAVSAAKPVLRLGSRGSAVVALQQRLTALHYFDVGAIDGVFGPNTYHAVVAFQKVQRIGRDGIVGPVTWSKLASPFRPAPRYPMAATSLEVDLTRQVVYYVSSRAVARILDASTGSGASYYSGGAWHRAITPTGRFKVYWRVNGWHQSPLGSLYRPNYFYGGDAIHGYTSVPAYPASHGCVRITIPTMDRMWASLRIGMPVAVYRS